MGNGAISSPKRNVRDFSVSILDVIDCQEDGSQKKNRHSQEQQNYLVCESMDESDLKHAMVDSLKHIFVFKSLDAKYIRELVDCFIPIKCNEGEVIIRQGELGDYMYVSLSQINSHLTFFKT
jgi:hypothetical protein